ncbi:hypothetical protein SRB5_53060 [Streptomyces sp. RB5]|uniref:Uncharacterized protein n=1 Tax=Streptomyces smaragdinus TaxID=2585196 RepID=A0A7K0CNS8_9ACTN|nr:hypothetical protein [Streptomyces smaragdinus]MQY15128.1 hypothetical protein [Streptomyces smaragdinus]
MIRKPTHLLMHYARTTHDDPAHEADRQTSMADARTALCLESGVAVDDIDPATGYDHSRRAYDAVRASWIDHIRQFGISHRHTRPAVDWIHDHWTQARPQFTGGDDWVTAGLSAHAEYARAHGCMVDDCEGCAPEPDTDAAPQWTAMTAADFSPEPKARQTALFATGDDGYGTDCLFTDAEGEPTYF